MFIEDNPKEKVYRALIDLVFGICDEFVLVIRKDISVSVNVNHVLEKLQSSLKDVKEQFE